MGPSQTASASKAAVLASLLASVCLMLTGAVHAAPSPTVCKLDIQGAPGQQLSKAALACSGGKVVAAVNQELLGGVVPKFLGVTMDPAGCGGLDCLLTLCGETDVVFRQPVVHGVGADSLQGLLCVTGASRVWLYGGSFLANQGAPVVWAGGASTLVVANSTFQDNACVGGGCGLLAVGSPKVKVNNTMFVGNSAKQGSGGALAAHDRAKVVVTGGSRLESNSAGNSGGACYAAESARLTLTGGTLFSNNTAGRLGPDVAVASKHNLVLGDTVLNVSSISWSQSGCVVGQVVDKWGGCQRCPADTYSLVNGTASSCKQCPTGGVCPGGAVVQLLPGFWKSSPTSGQVHRCPRAESCEQESKCSKGYSGNLCGAAAKGYSITRPFTSRKCMSARDGIGLYVSGVLALFVAICLMVMSTLQDNARCIEEARAQDVGDRKCTCPFRCGFVGVLVRHVQHLMVIGVSLLAGIWPTGMWALFTAVTWFFSVAGVSTEWASFQCWARGSSKVPWAVWKVLAGLLTPLVVFVAVATTLLVLRFLLRRMGLHNIGRPHNMFSILARASALAVAAISWLIVVLFFWPSLVYSSLSWFACYPIDRASADDPGAVCTAAHGFWVNDIQQPCFVGWHRKWTLALGLPVLFFILTTPLNILSGFYMNRAKLQTEEFKSIVGFMYHNYDKKFYYWESINAAEIAVVVAIYCFSYTLGPYYSILLLNISFGFFFLLQMAVHPHAYAELHRMQMISLGLLCFTTYIGLTLLPKSDIERVQPPLAYGVVIGICGLVVNVAYVAWSVWEICRLGRGKVVKAWGALVRCVRPRAGPRNTRRT